MESDRGSYVNGEVRKGFFENGIFELGFEEGQRKGYFRFREKYVNVFGWDRV